MFISNQKGTMLLYLISGIAMAAAIGVGMFYLISTQSLARAFGNETNRAYYLALAGKEYVIFTGYAVPTSQLALVMSNTEHFYISYNAGTGQFTSTGVVNEGTPFEARRTIQVPPQSNFTGS